VSLPYIFRKVLILTKRFVILAQAEFCHSMQKLSVDEIRRRFESSREFNEIFDAFEQAIEQHIDDIELYRQLFWNQSLKAEELTLFGEKLAKEYTHLSFDVYIWLARIFEVTHSVNDNYELALRYYRKAAQSRPNDTKPYLDAAACYEHDLRIPPIYSLIEFLKQGALTVSEPKLIYEKLAHFYELTGNDEMSMFYKRKLEEGQPPPSPPTNQ
jgi:tetratricopeptide (TPR) repeat protein